MKMKDIVVPRYDLDGKSKEKGLGGLQFLLGSHLKIYVAWETLVTNYGLAKHVKALRYNLVMITAMAWHGKYHDSN